MRIAYLWMMAVLYALVCILILVVQLLIFAVALLICCVDVAGYVLGGLMWLFEFGAPFTWIALCCYLLLYLYKWMDRELCPRVMDSLWTLRMWCCKCCSEHADPGL